MLNHGTATASQQFLERVGGRGLRVLSEPQQEVACAAPDLVVERDGVTT